MLARRNEVSRSWCERWLLTASFHYWVALFESVFASPARSLFASSMVLNVKLKETTQWFIFVAQFFTLTISTDLYLFIWLTAFTYSFGEDDYHRSDRLQNRSFGDVLLFYMLFVQVFCGHAEIYKRRCTFVIFIHDQNVLQTSCCFNQGPQVWAAKN